MQAELKGGVLLEEGKGVRKRKREEGKEEKEKEGGGRIEKKQESPA